MQETSGMSQRQRYCGRGGGSDRNSSTGSARVPHGSEPAEAEGCDFVVMHAGREVVRIAAKV
jgi:hypothetical protein